MTTGRPIATKCPRCKRGKYREEPMVLGVRRIVDAAQREVRRRMRRGNCVRTLTAMECLDCGHKWNTTLEK